MFYQAFKKFGKMHRYRDPIYGFILLSDAEEKIVDTPLFQRLRRIHQLALTKYVYPGAEHSRFVHSLGVLQSATEIFKNLLDVNQQKHEEIMEIMKDENGIFEALKTLRFAALLHDIGHLPFSHASEKILLEKSDHENIGKFIILNYEPIASIIKGNGVEPKDAANLLKPEGVIPDPRYNFLRAIISGQFDADRADYLLRDSYYCGVKYGEYDYKRYISALKFKEINPISYIVDINDVPILEEFLLARYHYKLQVLFHRSRVGFDISLKQYIKENKDQGIFKEFADNIGINNGNRSEIKQLDFNWFASFDDYAVFNQLGKQKETFWSNCLQRKEHLKMIKEKLSTSQNDKKIFKRLKQELEELNFIENKDFFGFIETLTVHKLGSDSDEKEEEYFVQDRNKVEIDYLNAYSPIFKAFEQMEPVIWRIYSKPDNEKEIAEAIQALRLKLHLDN